MRVRFRILAELNASSFISGNCFLFKSKVALPSRPEDDEGCIKYRASGVQVSLPHRYSIRNTTLAILTKQRMEFSGTP